MFRECTGSRDLDELMRNQLNLNPFTVTIQYIQYLHSSLRREGCRKRRRFRVPCWSMYSAQIDGEIEETTLSNHVHVHPDNLRGHRQEPDHIQKRHKAIHSSSELPLRTDSLPSASDSTQTTHRLVNRPFESDNILQTKDISTGNAQCWILLPLLSRYHWAPCTVYKGYLLHENCPLWYHLVCGVDMGSDSHWNMARFWIPSVSTKIISIRMEDLNQRIGVSLTIYHFETNFVLPPREDGTQLTVEEWKRDLLKKM